jgi:hypothetical protein
MITLEWFDGYEWVFVSRWVKEEFAWISLGAYPYNYRTLDEKGNVLTDKSKQEFFID